MKNFEEPLIEIIEFNGEDILSLSDKYNTSPIWDKVGEE